MSKQERKRPEKIQSEAGKEAGAFSLERRLTLPDLLLLLRNDDELRALIRKIVDQLANEPEEPADLQDAPEEIVEESAEAPPPPKQVMPAPQPASLSAPVDPLRRQLAAQLELLQAVLADEELASQWLGTDQEDEGQHLVRLIARVSQWDAVVDLWDLLANRCKQGKRAASAAELSILQAALSIHNLRWIGRQASFRNAAIGATYDFRLHQRGTSTGEVVQAEWLPGLTNAGGELHKSPLVQT